MGAINEDLGLNNGYKPILLANDGISGQALGIGIDRKLRRLVWPNLKHSTPLGETGTGLVVLGAPLAKVIVSLCGGLTVGSGKLDGALVDLDSW